MSVDDTWGKNDIRLKYLKNHYHEVYNDKTDILFYFLAKALRISRGLVGYIISRAFLQAYKADKLRSLLLSKSGEIRLVDFQNAEIFKGVGITTCIIFLNQSRRAKTVELLRLMGDADPHPLATTEGELLTRYERISIPQSGLSALPWEFTSAEVRKINSKTDRAGTALDKILILGQGMQTGRNEVFGGKSLTEIRLLGLEADSRYERARNSDIQRYRIIDSEEWLIYVEEFSTFSSLPKQTQDYLNSQKSVLSKRAAYQRGDCEWWKYTWPLHKDYYGRARIICPFLATKNQFALVSKDRILGLTDTTVAFENNQPENLKYLLALLNSKLLTFRFQSIGKMKGGGVLEYFWNSISKLPIRRIDFSNPADKTRHDEIVSLVDQILLAKKQLAAAQSDKDKDFYENKCAVLDGQIDKLVYELYGLTDDEETMVERSKL